MFAALVLFFAFFTSFVSAAEKTAIVAAPDGVPIHYAVQGKGEPTLVFIHCGGCDRHIWDNQVPVFAKNYRVVTIDLPGHGESGQGRKNWSIEGFADDVNTVITKLNREFAVAAAKSTIGTA